MTGISQTRMTGRSNEDTGSKMSGNTDRTRSAKVSFSTSDGLEYSLKKMLQLRTYTSPQVNSIINI